MSLKNKTAIITGAGTGIGEAIVQLFVREGANVALVGRRAEKLEAASEGLPAEQVLCVPCDVADRDGVNAMAAKVIEHFGKVDILVNNAGMNTNPRSVGEVAPEDWDKTIQVNLTGVFNCVRAVLPGMREQRDGLIINVSSIAGVRSGKLGGAAYCASKFGVVALTTSINEEEVEYRIRATAICPGEVETPILEKRPEPVSAERRANMLQPIDVAEAALFVAKLPPRACVNELLIKPTTQHFN
ncbi:MAG: SDR family oxidoreductase [Planctomycetota bacterium]|nr:SDR family oxidoreductase [Planctomycetota bacterium]MDA1142114.1 SDR family oxidoreductase [Planctomycetota bacterium]